MRLVWSNFCLVFVLMLVACSKSSNADKLPPMEFEGVKVDTPQLMAEFVTASPQLQQSVNDAVTKIRYRQYLDAMMELDGVLKAPNLKDQQKKLIAQVMDQLKEVFAKAPPRPGQ